MNRTDEFARIVSIFAPIDEEGILQSQVNSRTSNYLAIACRVNVYLDNNDALVNKMRVLSDRKEFSNDPTAALADASKQFQDGVSHAQGELARLKNLSDSTDTKGLQQQQHRRLLFQGLNKRLNGHIEAFQTAVKSHAMNVKTRNMRVDRYGNMTTIPTVI